MPAPEGDTAPAVPKIAAVVSVYHENSHAEVIVSRLVQGYNLNGQGDFPKMKLVSLFTDQTPASDISRRIMADAGVPVFDTVEKALTLGTDSLAVDGILLVAEHGDYPRSATGQIIYPKRRLFDAILEVLKNHNQSVPLFIDKHLADNWADAEYIYQSCRQMQIPLMAGSSVPGLWRFPAMDLARDAKVDQIVAVSYHTLDAYGFHAMEAVQALAERRAGGETGVKEVRALEDHAVWNALADGTVDRSLLQAALDRLRPGPIAIADLPPRVEHPVLFTVKYLDGLTTHVLTLNYAVSDWTAAWRENGQPEIRATVFATQEARPFTHFSFLVQGIEQMMHSGQPAWPVERTLLTSGQLDALLISKSQGGVWLQTPYLDIDYQNRRDWSQPPLPQGDSIEPKPR